MTRTELIAALEAAEGPSRELGDELAFALGWVCTPPVRGRCWIDPQGGKHHHRPDFLGSIDAALSFTPEGWRVHEFQEADDGRWRCRVVRAQGRGGDSETGGWWRPTAAIALCIANLKAREAQE
ncbi:MAG: hypothetical protein ACR2RF_32085 [Geminicoccaceae bacterium]